MRTQRAFPHQFKIAEERLFISNLTSVVLENEREATFESFHRSDLPEITK